MNNIAQFFADFPDDTVREFDGAIGAPNGKALARTISDELRAAGHSSGPPVVAGRAWSFTTPVRQGAVVCTLQHRDRWYLATESREGASALLLGRHRLDDDYAEMLRDIDRVLRSNTRIRGVQWISKEDLDARVTTIPAATYEDLVEHGLSSAFARFVTDGRRHIAEVRHWCADPNESWKYYVAPEIERPRQLWSTNADPTIVAVMDNKTAFLRLYHDDVRYQFIGHSETTISKALLTQVMESEGWEDEDDTWRRLRHLAGVMGYPHFDALQTENAVSDSSDRSAPTRPLNGKSG